MDFEDELEEVLAEFYRRRPVFNPQTRIPFQVQVEERSLETNRIEQSLPVKQPPNYRSQVFDAPRLDLWVDSVGDKSVELRWSDAPDQGSTWYKLSRGISPGGPYTQLLQESLDDHGKNDQFQLVNGTTYYYVVQWSTDDNGPGTYSPDSNEVSATPKKDEPPPAGDFPVAFNGVKPDPVTVGSFYPLSASAIQAGNTFYPYNGNVKLNFVDGFLTIYNSGGSIAWSGTPNINVQPAAVKAMVNGNVAWTIRVSGGVSVPPGGFSVGYANVDIRNPANLGQTYPIYGDPLYQPLYLRLNLQ